MLFEGVLNAVVLKCHKYSEVILGVDIPLCYHNIFISTVNSTRYNNNKDIQMSQNTTIFIIIYYLRATCFDSFKSSSGPPMNRPKTI